MELEVVSSRESMAVTIIDDGSPFDPTDMDAHERRGDEEHGMGISLMRTIADELNYEYRDSRNRFTLTFHRSRVGSVI
jgi:anti-sigma regulatory factor (Ser/Thr protein kinase)